jgi:hypothetical protein
MSDELDQLRARFPDWKISEHWITAASGPDMYYLHAERGDTDINAGSATELARLIRNADTGEDLGAQVERLACAVPALHRFTARRILRAYRSGHMSPRVALAQLRAVL